MKNIFLIALLVLLSFHSCEERALKPNNGRAHPLVGKWYLSQLELEGQGLVAAPQRYSLEFMADSTIRVSLDINSCGGQMALAGKNVIFDEGYCTEACCDSDFAKAFFQAILDANTWQINEAGELIFEGVRKVILSKLDSRLTGKWQLSALETDSGLVEHSENKYWLEIKENATAIISLDVNEYVALVTTHQNQITFTDQGGTDACCDSEFGLAFLNSVHAAKTFTFNGDQLVLEGAGKVVLRKEAVEIYQRWYLQSSDTTSAGPDTPVSSEEGYWIEFSKEGRANVRLDANTCFSNFEIQGAALSFGGFGCTKVCCDSQAAMDFLQVLQTVTHHKIENGILTLEGDRVLMFKGK